MKQILPILILILLSNNAISLTVEDLKNTPASKYDLVVLRMRTMALEATLHIKGKRPEKYRQFEIRDSMITEENGKIYVVTKISGPAKDISQDMCNYLKEYFVERSALDIFKKEALSGLTSEEFKTMSELIYPGIELIATENPDLKINCR
ncbi:hypothetical protein [Haliea sp. E17]|uniref:hypothetical protein n=1 Tax=Haliea sp. E17 TaxID=3401576 RepID=UPI003AAD3038